MIRILTILLSLVTSAGLAQVNVTAKADTAFVLIGDPITIDLSANFPNSIRLEWPFLVERIGEFDILKSGKLDTMESGSSKTIRQQMKVAVYDTGYFAFPGIPFEYRTAQDDSIQILRTNPIMIRAETFEIDTAELKIMDIKPIMEIPFSWVEIIPLLRTINAILVGLALLVFFVLLRRRKPVEVEETEIVIPDESPRDKAIRKLDRLFNKKLWQSGHVKEYYAEISLIFREFLENKFDIQALESVTGEIIDDMKKLGASTDEINQLRSILSRADLVKYAKAEPSVKDHTNAIDEVKDYIGNIKSVADD